jgi:hypothetical protein
VVVAAPKPTTTGPTPPSGKKPKHFKTGSGVPSTQTSSDGGGTNWTAIGAGLGGAAVLIAAAAFVMLRRRGPVG